MRFNFDNVKSMKIPEGTATKILWDGKSLWPLEKVRYVSLGDSIAAGQNINADWESDYGLTSQFGEKKHPYSPPNTYTVIVPGCYTDLINKELVSKYGVSRVATTSFAHSGDTVGLLIAKLYDNNVVEALSTADIVTICIGANELFAGALTDERISDYALNGNIEPIASAMNTNLGNMDNDEYQFSFKKLLDRLIDINPNAKYVFTTVYNPYKYLFAEKSTADQDYKNGVFGPLMWAIPDIGFDLANQVRGAIMKSSFMQSFFDRFNYIASFVETYVRRLNSIISNKITVYGKDNIILTDAKAIFDSFPDRPIEAPVHYNDLVNVEITRGYTVEQLDWGNFWANADWLKIIANPTDIAVLAAQEVLNKVLIPDTDVHPEEYGQYALKAAFAEALGWKAIPRYVITYNPGAGSGVMDQQIVVALDNMKAYAIVQENTFSIPDEGYRFTKWLDENNNNTLYDSGSLIGLTGNITLTAQWSNIYNILFMHSNKTNLYGDDETGHMECYALWIDGEEQADFGKFSDGSQRIIKRPYNARVGVVVSNYNPSEITYDDCDCTVYLNNNPVASGYRGTSWEFDLKSDVIVDFQWKIAGSLATFDAQSWEDCYITTL